jgi:hypothetical protein
MEKSNGIKQFSNDKSVLLKNLKVEQEQYTEGSKQWTYIQENINQIVAQNYLEYVNR